MDFASVIAEGESKILMSDEEIREGLNQIIKHFKIPKGKMNPQTLQRTKVIKFTPRQLTMKKYK